MLALQLLLLSAPPVCDPADPAICVQVLEAGERAPFSGILYTHRASAMTTARLERAREDIALAVNATASVARAEVASVRRLHQAEVGLLSRGLDRQEGQLRASDEKLQALQDPPWYKTQFFAFAMGVLAAGVVTVGTAAMIHEFTP